MAKKTAVQVPLFDLGPEEWEEHWRSMPEFDQRDLTSYDSVAINFAEGDVHVHFETPADKRAFELRLSAAVREAGGKPPRVLGRDWFGKIVEQRINPATRSVWYPEAEIGHFAGKWYAGTDPAVPRVPRFPVFVPTKGRWGSNYTVTQLARIGVPFRAVVEAQEAEAYARSGIPEDRLLVVPHRDKGLVVTRNWIWDRAREEGHRYFWTMDDNIGGSGKTPGFYRLNKNLKTPVSDGTMLWAIEQFALRYSNLPVCGMNYFMFASRKTKMPPLYLNTRVYSNMLIETDYRDPWGKPYRNEGFYNDDTDLCLRVLKDGGCTALFNAFLILKSTTMTVRGGMTSHYQRVDVKPEWRSLAERVRGLYQDPEDDAEDEDRLADGRWRMAAELAEKHRDVTRISHKWNRWQHHVDYSRWTRVGRTGNRLRLREGAEVPAGTNDFGMVLSGTGQRDAVGPAEPLPEAPDGVSLGAKGNSPFARNRLRPGLEVPEGADEYGMELRKIEGPAEPEPEEPAPAAHKPVTFTFKTSGPVGPMPGVQTSLSEAMERARPVPDGWRPDEPPDLRAWGVREIALDFETTGLRWWAGDRPIGAAVAWVGEGGRVEARYLPWGHRGGNLDEGAVKRWFHDQLPGLTIKNLQTKFDAHFSQEWGADLDAMGCRLGDVAHYAALLDDHRGEGWRRPEKPFSLEAVGLDYAGEGKVKDNLDKSRMAEYHAHAITAYGRQDVALVVKVWRAQRPLLEAEGLLEVAALEDSVIPVVVEMERNAARINVPLLRQWAKESEDRLFALRLQLAKDVGWDVNPDSPEDMARLFRQLGIKSEHFTETCPNCSAKTEGAPVCPSCGAAGRESFAAGVLKEHDENPTISRVVRVSHLTDLRSKFLVPYNDAVGDDGLLRFEFHQLKGDKWGTVSGRFSASKPTGSRKGANVQQVYAVDNQVRMHCSTCAAEWGSRKTKDQVALHRAEHEDVFLVRELFVPDPDPGVTLVASDAEQIEYRTFAHLSRSARLIEAYRKDPRCDFHEWTGAEVRKHRPDFERKRLKIANFSLLFGAGITGTANLLNVSEEEAKEFRAFYFGLFPEAKDLMDAAMDVAFTPGRYRRRDSKIVGRGYVKTILGRRARFPLAKRLHAALNRAVSGSAADLNKMKLRTLYRLRRELGLKMRMTIHDEVVADIPTDNVARFSAVMDQQEVPLRVPILWSTKTGANWAEAK